jgi:hypothetical protein
LILLALVSFLVGLFMNNQDHEGGPSAALIGGVILGGILVAAYFLTRKQVVRVASSSTQIRVALVGMSLEKAVEVIDAVESAKNARQGMRQAATPGAYPAGAMRLSQT